MASSNPNSPNHIAEIVPTITESPQDLAKFLDEEISPFSTPGEVDDVVAGVDKQSSIRNGILIDVVCEKLQLL